MMRAQRDEREEQRLTPAQVEALLPEMPGLDSGWIPCGGSSPPTEVRSPSSQSQGRHASP